MVAIGRLPEKERRKARRFNHEHKDVNNKRPKKPISNKYKNKDIYFDEED